MPATSAQLQVVIRLLAAEFGEPSMGDDRAAAWRLGSDDAALHLTCEPLELHGTTRVWIHDPLAAGDGQIHCSRVATHDDIAALVRDIRRRLSRSGPRSHG
jgi:hypothetical protein